MSNPIKSVALVNDLCGLGRCSLSVAVPIISALGVQAVPVPTSIFSCHTGYESFSFMDFTPYLSEFIKSLEEQEQKIDMIYTGFVGSEKQMDIIADFVNRSNAYILVDPVMGDHGKAYSTYTKEMCEKMKSLVAHSDITTPNLTEACILSDTEYKESFTDDELISISKKVCSLGTKVCVITGIVKDNNIDTFVYKDNGTYFINENERTEIMYAGTGDIFASVLCGKLASGECLEKSIECACDFVSKTTKYTMELDTPIIDGIVFEPLLTELK